MRVPKIGADQHLLLGDVLVSINVIRVERKCIAHAGSRHLVGRIRWWLTKSGRPRPTADLVPSRSLSLVGHIQECLLWSGIAGLE